MMHSYAFIIKAVDFIPCSFALVNLWNDLIKII